MTAPLRVGIVGAGAIGRKRAAAIGPEAFLVAVSDIDPARAHELAHAYGAASVGASWNSMFEQTDVVIVSTTHDALAKIAVAALAAHNHVLVEKPGGRTADELRQIAQYNPTDRVVRVGCNHRFHPAFQELKHRRLGLLGPLMNIRARYGHGGRLSYEKEWRAQPERSGGGELIDQGVHLIDLCNWLVPDGFALEWGTISRQFWDMDVEDNALVALRSGCVRAVLHVSCTEWKNLFDFEIACRRGKFQVTGLGRSYGIEALHAYKMREEMGPPDHETTVWTGEDVSWRAEWLGFVAATRGETTDNATISDAVKAVAIVEQVYRQCGAGWVK